MVLIYNEFSPSLSSVRSFARSFSLSFFRSFARSFLLSRISIGYPVPRLRLTLNPAGERYLIARNNTRRRI